MFYIHQSMGKKIKQYLPKYRTRLSEYDAEKLIEELQKDSTVNQIYLYKIIYEDGQISLFANPNKPIGELKCEDNK